MAWSQKQISWYHQLKLVACVTDEYWRDRFQMLTQCVSSTESQLTHADFERVMRELEIEIARAISDGLTTPEHVLSKVSDPWSFHRKSAQEYTPKFGRKESGKRITHAQRGLIAATQRDLVKHEPQFAEWYYIQRTLANVKNKDIPDTIDELSTDQASTIIDVLKSHLTRYESSSTMRRPNLQGMLQSAEVSYENKDPLPF